MKYIICVLVLVSIFVYSCDPSFDCEEVDTLTVFDDLRNVDSIVYMSERLITPSDIFDTTYQEMVVFINNDSTYAALKQRGVDANCSSCTFPNIDFTNRTLIGHYFQIGCLDLTQQRFVTTSDSDSTYAFYSKFINTSKCNFANCYNETFNWMLVPKVDDVSQIEFYNGNLFYDCDC